MDDAVDTAVDTAIVAAEWVIVPCLLLIVFCVAYVWFRRRHIARGQTLLLGAVRTEAKPRWRLGLLRLRGDRLEWFSVVGPRLGPERTWIRHQLDLSAPETLAEEIPGLPSPVSVSTGRDQTWLAFTPSTYTAVRAWLESSPPGLNINNVA